MLLCWNCQAGWLRLGAEKIKQSLGYNRKVNYYQQQNSKKTGINSEVPKPPSGCALVVSRLMFGQLFAIPYILDSGPEDQPDEHPGQHGAGRHCREQENKQPQAHNPQMTANYLQGPPAVHGCKRNQVEQVEKVRKLNCVYDVAGSKGVDNSAYQQNQAAQVHGGGSKSAGKRSGQSHVGFVFSVFRGTTQVDKSADWQEYRGRNLDAFLLSTDHMSQLVATQAEEQCEGQEKRMEEGAPEVEHDDERNYGDQVFFHVICALSALSALPTAIDG